MTESPGEPKSWLTKKSELIERLFDKRHKSLGPSEQYGRIYLLNDRGEIVLSLGSACDAYDQLAKRLAEADAVIKKTLWDLDDSSTSANECLCRIRTNVENFLAGGEK